MINLKFHTQSRQIWGWRKLDFWDKSNFSGVHIRLSLNKLFAVEQLISKKFQSQTFSLTFVLLKTHCKDSKSYERSNELLPNVCWISAYFHLVCHFLHERQITNDEMKFLLTLECNHFPKYMMENVVNTFAGIWLPLHTFIFLNNQIFTNFSLLCL